MQLLTSMYRTISEVIFVSAYLVNFSFSIQVTRNYRVDRVRIVDIVDIVDMVVSSLCACI